MKIVAVLLICLSLVGCAHLKPIKDLFGSSSTNSGTQVKTGNNLIAGKQDNRQSLTLKNQKTQNNTAKKITVFNQVNNWWLETRFYILLSLLIYFIIRSEYYRRSMPAVKFFRKEKERIDAAKEVFK